MLAQQASRLQARRPAPGARRVVIRSALDTPRQSVDPMAAKPRAAKAEPGGVWSIQTPEDVDKVLGENKDRLVLIMCKASHCKPCKTFMPKYYRMAELLEDSVLCELTGDMSQELKKMMISWGVSVTLLSLLSLAITTAV
ncbi:hypothetical protein HYH03_015457 [Edaphochlamys debaryana]|uniref:Thioredoxin domain-containing protein n=1 Tax=Edaphochlamys debaryana TaxID=47281 RepID=A0A836BSJ1_9CHLO|nr:hypothetical protein HYH03_015457 [Edaphochlamys debaryana]|eukprot:KAG2485874.1 hypothetical protein HYH03_015457 [Edaphochlamys debaryana]